MRSTLTASPGRAASTRTTSTSTATSSITTSPIPTMATEAWPTRSCRPTGSDAGRAESKHKLDAYAQARGAFALQSAITAGQYSQSRRRLLWRAQADLEQPHHPRHSAGGAGPCRPRRRDRLPHRPRAVRAWRADLCRGARLPVLRPRQGVVRRDDLVRTGHLDLGHRDGLHDRRLPAGTARCRGDLDRHRVRHLCRAPTC